MKTEQAIQAELRQMIDAGTIPPFVYCYPPRSAYRVLGNSVSKEAIWRADRQWSGLDLTLYIHVPFCRYKCGFCNLYTVVDKSKGLFQPYVDALCRELLNHSDIISERRLRTVYVGGGTPTLLSTEQLTQLFETLGLIYPNWKSVVEEVAIEATPDSIVDNSSLLGDLVALGLTRVNLGVESLSDAELQRMGRGSAGRHCVRQAVEIVHQSGVGDLSTDLIMGFEGQTNKGWERSVEELLGLHPTTISTYFLTVRPDAWFSRTGAYRYARDSMLYDRYDAARSLILAEGFVQESNVRYKRPGRGGYRQKVLQFQGVPVLGIGVGARNYTNSVDYMCGGSSTPQLQQVADFVDQVSSGREQDISVGFVFDDEERLRKRLALDQADMTIGELPGATEFRHIWEPLVGAAVSEGLLAKIGNGHYQLTSSGFKYRDIMSWLAFSNRVVERDGEFYRDMHLRDNRLVALHGLSGTASGVSMSG